MYVIKSQIDLVRKQGFGSGSRRAKMTHKQK
jgi:hypothetical protein